LAGDNRFVGALTDLDDRAVLARVADGDSVAFRELYTRHAPWLGVRLRRRCADTEVVEEALQDAFVAVWKGASRFRDDGDVAAWMWGIAIRRLISRLRGKPALDVVPLQEHDGVEVAAEEVVLTSIEYGDLGGALARLPREFLAVIEATVLDGLSTKEAAQLLGIPEATVKTRALRARARLRANLAGGIT
jgi:RNA polymerase sigma factor (sigma-70 family)